MIRKGEENTVTQETQVPLEKLDLACCCPTGWVHVERDIDFTDPKVSKDREATVTIKIVNLNISKTTITRYWQTISFSYEIHVPSGKSQSFRRDAGKQ